MLMRAIDPRGSHALILAAGQGRRLGGNALPKSLLKFDGISLLLRHAKLLAACGVRDVTVVIGYRAPDLRSEFAGWKTDTHVEFIENPSFREGSIVSLWHARSVLRDGAPIILMDADVLYDRRLMQRLLDSAHENCFLLDREIEPGDEPVKLCIAQGRIADFHKRPQIAHEWHGESVGFFRFSSSIAAELAERVEAYVATGWNSADYEEPIRDMLLARCGDEFGFEDVTGLPWIEIDFPEDVERARRSILPRLSE
jgi:choline kinase